ncbi:type II toxin-antitoxin system death-on-curing family toxin [Deinococcus ruber]|uniref:Death-on-curing protein n=1 Tax=Deinococcus ruber TaxID=1848197 RepID=A0A918C6T6_9DEIO|nr:Fic family protein [Deinococcus ruber]GGR09598.1 death-on-curing protein [Deinococcus ruber]
MSSEGYTVEEVLEVHEHLLELFGGRPGVRDLAGLESTLEQPLQQMFGQRRFEQPAQQAGAYLFFVAQAHAFIDGNKRTALALCLNWMRYHGLEMTDEDALYDLTLRVAQGQVNVQQAGSILEHLIDR